jgi:hypothetical protein
MTDPELTMSDQESPIIKPYNSLSLVVRFLIVLAVSVFAALAFSSLTGREGQWPGLSIPIKLASAAGIGLTAGYFTRVLLAARRPFLRLVISLGGALAGLLVLGLMTNWRNGIGPLYYFRSTIDWRGLGLFLGAAGCCVIASLAYRKPLRPSRRSTAAEETVDALPARSSSRDTTQPVRSMTHKVSRVSKKTFGKTGKRSPVRSKKTTSKTSAKTGKKPLISKQKKPAGTTVIRKRSSKKIVIAPVEEHRCPYCLEPVKRNDPRGVVECDICHTLHHADCWAITGTCQVPHYNH